MTRRGKVHVHGAEFVAGYALASHRVGLEPLDGSKYQLWFRHLDLGTVDIGPPDFDIDITCQSFLEKRRRKVA